MGTAICICDDHDIVTEGIAHYLSKEEEKDYKLYSADTGAKCTEYLKRYELDLLILDLNLPDISGLELLEIVRKQYPDLPVLILTMYKDPFILERIKDLEGNGYMLKDFGLRELQQALKCVEQDKFYTSPGINRSVESNSFSGIYRLTNREKEIIKYTASGKTTRELAEMLYISPHTINTHRQNIYKKLNINSVNELISFAHKNGFT